MAMALIRLEKRHEHAYRTVGKVRFSVRQTEKNERKKTKICLVS